MTVHVIYGSDGGATRRIAERIAEKLSARTIPIGEASIADFEGCDLLVLGSPTYGIGDLQIDWETGVDLLDAADLNGKRVALFGLGDQSGYPDSFVDALGILYDHVVARGAEVVGFTDTTGYSYDESKAVRDGRFVGLVIDQDGQAGKTGKRIEAWTSRII